MTNYRVTITSEAYGEEIIPDVRDVTATDTWLEIVTKDGRKKIFNQRVVDEVTVDIVR